MDDLLLSWSLEKIEIGIFSETDEFGQSDDFGVGENFLYSELDTVDVEHIVSSLK